MARIRAPEFPKNTTWLNTDRPLSLKELKGRIIILDFWTYCCINCLHVLPELKYLENKYKNSLTVIGVHSGKFNNEKNIENIRQAILRYDIEHPVIVDNNFDIWHQYVVRAWPTLVLIDTESYYLGSVAGEGNRDALDEVISQVITKHQESGKIQFAELNLNLEKQRKPVLTPLAFPGKVLADERGDRLFIADSGHHRIIISNLAGEILHIIGTGKPGLTDGAFNEAQFFAPQGMALDSDHQILYIADTENHCLRLIYLEEQMVTTIAGTGEQSHQIFSPSKLGLQTALNSPWDVEKIGNKLFIAMAGSHQIWQMDITSGIIQNYAGIGAESCVDGLLAESAFSQPSGITTDGKELYIADSEISSIRGVGTGENATVTTLCGSGELFGFGDKDGYGLEVRLQHCLGVEYSHNYLWVADTYNHKIKRVNTRNGYCETIIGNNISGYKDGEAKNSLFSEPSGLSATKSHLYIADTNNHCIRQVELDTMQVKTMHFPGLCSPNICFPS